MASTSQAARRYAEALLAAAGSDDLQQVANEITDFAKAAEASADLRNVLQNPTFSDEERDQAITAVMTQMQMSDRSQKFVKLLIERDRQSELDSISDTFSKLVADRMNRSAATIRTAAELDPATQDQIKAALEKRTGKTLDISVVVDPSLIAGIRAEIGSVVFDGTVKAELEKLSETLSV